MIADDAALAVRAVVLSESYLGGHAQPTSVRWVGDLRSRWGSCSPAEGSIRISGQLRGVPDYVLDYVVLHELAHLLVPRHGPDFWTLLRGYPHTDRARAHLAALDASVRPLDEADE
jgi:predicted metal-dependent hydrolase